MAFGTGARSFGPNAVLYSFKIKTKDLPAPVFEVKKKGEDGKYTLLPKTASRVSGHIIEARWKETQHEGKTIKSLSITQQDGNDIYFVSVGQTFLGRNLYNALLNLNTFDDIEIGLYQSKPKPGAVDKRGFASVSLRQHNEMVRGKYDPKTEMPLTKKVRVNGKDQTDSEELDLWLEIKMKEWCKKVNAAAPKRASAPAADTPTDGAGDDTPSHDAPEGSDEQADPNAPPF